ncbi:MFS transporter [Corynebacterium poyangense]|uniref:MFS transporter n=1 Tax=Corynebacterium poyangense TaxID=2684405 RepID=A0A7H0SR04_9CORY|nr:MFS transporter [Corynebacterium poyangense]QNQ90979.1 MFS transporter [Corynebacterium poyangense]
MENSQRTDRLTIFSWGLWDWGSAAFNAVLVTFIFAVYLTDSVGIGIPGSISPTQWYGVAMAISGVAIAVVAPVMGLRTDHHGTRRRAVAVWSLVTVVLMASLVLVSNSDSRWFWYGITIMAIASVTFQFAEVNYYAMLRQVSHPDNVGKVSGFGWSMGYFGGIVLLLFCFLGFINGGSHDGVAGLFNITKEDGWNIRWVAITAAAWFFIFGLPVVFRVPEIPPQGSAPGGFRSSYARLWRDLQDLWHADRHSIYFLMSSAIFRDGLAGVFTFGAVIAVSVYGLSSSEVLLFGVAANVVSALGALFGGLLDDKLGPKPVILVSLLAMILVCAVLFFVTGPLMFWVFGLILCAFVGPAQSASRTFLSRITPPGHDGQMFGLYATTGRAVSWIAPAMFFLAALIGGGDRAGIIGIMLVLAVGAGLLFRVRRPGHHSTSPFVAS